MELEGVTERVLCPSCDFYWSKYSWTVNPICSCGWYPEKDDEDIYAEEHEVVE